MASKIKGLLEREVVTVDGKVLVASLTSEGVYMREKGRRTKYGPVGWGYIFHRGAEMAAIREREERTTRKVVRKMSRGLLST